MKFVSAMIWVVLKFQVEAFKRDREFRHAELKRMREEEQRKQEEEAIRNEMLLRAREKERMVGSITLKTFYFSNFQVSFQKFFRVLKLLISQRFLLSSVISLRYCSKN